MSLFGRIKKRLKKEKELPTFEARDLHEEIILKDMKRMPIKYDLREKKWREHPEKFLKKFRDNNELTNTIRVPEDYEDWLIGQERAKKYFMLLAEEWIRTVKWFLDFWKKGKLGKLKGVLAERIGPIALMVGPPGCGKSLLIKIIAQKLGRLYEKHNIKLFDLVSTENKRNEYKPNIWLIPSGLGERCQKIAEERERERGKQKLNWIKILLTLLIAVGGAFITTGVIEMWRTLHYYGFTWETWTALLPILGSSYFLIGIFMLSLPLTIYFYIKFFGGMQGVFMPSEMTMKTPHILVNNAPPVEMYIDATGKEWTKLCGDIEWTAFGPEIGKPAYKRMQAGDIHNAHLKILYYDEIMNLLILPNAIIELLTILQDGWSRIKAHPALGAGCMPPNEIVIEKTPKEICSFKVGDLVLTRSGYRKVLNVLSRDYDGFLYTIKAMGNFPVTVTKEHPFLICDSKDGENIRWKDAENLSGNEYVLVPRLKDEIVPAEFEKYPLEPLMKYLGLYLAEGDYQKRSGRRGVLTLYLGRHERELAFEMFRVIEEMGFRPRIYTKTKSLDVSLTDNDFAELVRGLVGKYSHQKFIHPKILMLPRRLLSIFLEYYNIGDGDSTKRINLKITTASRSIVRALQIAYAKIGHSSSYHIRKGGITIHGHRAKDRYVFQNWENPRKTRILEDHWVVPVTKISKKHYSGKVWNLTTEDGTYCTPVITHNTAGLMVESPPIPTIFWFIGAGNLNVILDPNSPINKIPAFRDRLQMIYMDNVVENTPYNEMMMCQAITDELYRHGCPPMTAEGVDLIIDYVRQRAPSKNYLKLVFRPILRILRLSASLAWKEGSEYIKTEHVQEAIDEWIKNVHIQMQEKRREIIKKIKIIDVTGAKKGQINALAVVGDPITGESVGFANQVTATLRPESNPDKAVFKLTGVMQGKETWVQKSKDIIISVINQLYDINLEKEYYCHIDKTQEIKVEGPSAGMATTLLLMSLLGDPRLPKEERKPLKIRQDVCMTGTIEMASDDGKNFTVGPIGGVWEKARGGEFFGIKECLVPQTNFDLDFKPEDLKKFKIKITPVKTLMDAFDMVMVKNE